MPFICECADGDCIGRIEITARRYEDIHSEERGYVILPSHMRIAGEEIMERNSYYEGRVRRTPASGRVPTRVPAVPGLLTRVARIIALRSNSRKGSYGNA